MNAKNVTQGATVNRGRTLTISASLSYFVFSLIINAAGNVLTVVTSQKIHPTFLGSAYWTAAQAGFNKAVFQGSNGTLGWIFFIVGVLIAILNVFLQGYFNWKKFVGNIAFMVPFSLLISFFASAFSQVLPESHSVLVTVIYTLLNFLGVVMIGLAISIYQRTNLILHPADDLMQILRFKYFKGAAAKAMWASYIPPTIIGIVAIIILPDFSNYGLGTIFAFLFQGGITGWGDKYIFPNLKHQGI
ncbi:fructose permease [Leuconostoc rapi]|uniref:fructose permease n=1 Tax=Leuconostoc rapi TaxID=1406906 RepID=UPI00195EBDA5|nr:fructose permease [Leuconostoc rapi]MBM7436033.1 putative membrane protein YczE [Leuconostoc rapi]